MYAPTFDLPLWCTASFFSALLICLFGGTIQLHHLYARFFSTPRSLCMFGRVCPLFLFVGIVCKKISCIAVGCLLWSLIWRIATLSACNTYHSTPSVCVGVCVSVKERKRVGGEGGRGQSSAMNKTHTLRNFVHVFSDDFNAVKKKEQEQDFNAVKKKQQDQKFSILT